MSYQSVGVSGVTSVNKIIPEYAREYKNEYLFIRGINKTCGNFLNELDIDVKIFNTHKAYNLMFYFRRFLKAQELGYLKDISEIYFEESDVNYIESLGLLIDDYLDLFFDPYSYDYDPKKYDNVYPGLREFSDYFERFDNKVKIKETTYSDFLREIKNLDSDSNSD